MRSLGLQEEWSQPAGVVFHTTGHVVEKGKDSDGQGLVCVVSCVTEWVVLELCLVLLLLLSGVCCAKVATERVRAVLGADVSERVYLCVCVCRMSGRCCSRQTTMHCATLSRSFPSTVLRIC